MKRLSLFEITVIGFLVSIVLSTGIIYLVGNDSYISEAVTVITLRPIFDHFFTIPSAYSLYGSFLFLVIVFTVYSTIIGLVLQRARKVIVIGGLAVLLFAVGFDQKIGMEKHAAQTAATITQYRTSSTPPSI